MQQLHDGQYSEGAYNVNEAVRCEMYEHLNRRKE